MEIVPVITPIAIAATGVAQAASATSIVCRGFSIRVPTTNAADVQIGWDGTNYLTVFKGTEWGPKSMDQFGLGLYDLKSLKVKGTINDVATIVSYA